MRRLKFLNFCFRKFFKVSSVPIRFFFEILQQWMLKNLKGPPFTVFGIVRFFEMNNFCPKIWFSGPARYVRFLFFFEDRCFYASFFLILFFF